MNEVKKVGSILFVCLGNICRSPLAEGVCRSHIGLNEGADGLLIDSAGTGSWHIGDPPDQRMIETARKYGVDIRSLRGRQFSQEDFENFDLILAMDRQNLNDIIAQSNSPQDESKVRLFRSFDPAANEGDLDVPDPYYGGQLGFDNVYAIVDRTIRSMLSDLGFASNV